MLLRGGAIGVRQQLALFHVYLPVFAVAPAAERSGLVIEPPQPPASPRWALLESLAASGFGALRTRLRT